MRKIYTLLTMLLALSFPLSAGTLSMSSENYAVMTDVVSVGGGTTTSTNYQLLNIVGEATGVNQTTSTSANYTIYAGFGGTMDAVGLAATLSKTAISFGTLTLASVSSDSQTLTVSTNASTGYTTTITADGALRSGANTIPGVTGGTVTAGTAGYGVRTSGAGGQMNSADTALSTSAQTLASSAAPVSAQQTTITYKAAVGSVTAAGNYSQTVTITTVVNL